MAFVVVAASPHDQHFAPFPAPDHQFSSVPFYGRAGEVRDLRIRDDVWFFDVGDDITQA